jgi:hypothetical protein
MEKLKENKSIITSCRLSQDAKYNLQQKLKDLRIIQEQYFNKVVKFMELDIVKQDNSLRKDTTIIQCKLEAILNTFISVADGSNILINNKDVDLEILKLKYKNMLSDKENYITEQNQELQKVYSDLIILQKENKKNVDELLSIRIEHNNKMEQFWERV